MSNLSKIPIIKMIVQQALDDHFNNIEKHTKADVITISGPLIPPLEPLVLRGLDDKTKRNDKICVIIETYGGIIHTVEKMVRLIRRLYEHVSFIIPNEAMSAGTVFVLSGDEILMNYHSYLGPVDPQVYDSDQQELVPALSYLSQFEILNEKARNEEITAAELVLIDNIDPGKLHQYGQEKELTVELIVDWLCKYKFKNWDYTESTNEEVSENKKRIVAQEIASKLSDNELWHSHSRGIDLETITDKVQLKVTDYSDESELYDEIKHYMSIVQEYKLMTKQYCFVQTKEYKL